MGSLLALVVGALVGVSIIVVCWGLVGLIDDLRRVTHGAR
jgi:hypothetical protein